MTEGQLTMSAKEQRRAQVLNRVLAGTWTRQQAAATLGRSERQLRRLLRAYQARGPAGVVHGNRGRRPAHTLSATVRERVLELARTTYAGCNDVHFAELLAEREAGIAVSRATLQRWRRAAAAGGLAGVASPRSRRRPRHRTRRERAAREGQLVQADGSPHRWLGPDGPEWTLIAGIDDATGIVPWALFRQQEDAAGYMAWLRHVVETKGVPLAVYVDRHGIFQRRHHARHEVWTLEEELAGGPLPTQMGRVFEELGIRVIHALSPQAKGRVERLFGTLQDRLCAELRLAVRRRSMTRTACSPPTCHASTPASPSHRPRPPVRTAASPTCSHSAWGSTRCAASSTSASWGRTTPCASARTASSSRRDRAARDAPTPGHASKSTSGSTAASPSSTTGTCSPRHQRLWRHRSYGRARSPGHRDQPPHLRRQRQRQPSRPLSVRRPRDRTDALAIRNPQPTPGSAPALSISPSAATLPPRPDRTISPSSYPVRFTEQQHPVAGSRSRRRRAFGA